MKKKKIALSNIQENHTLGEYQRYFSHLLMKGKLHRYKLSEKVKLNPKRQYWKITDDKGDTYFYELPKYIKPGYSKSAYSMKRVMHRRPARAAIAIFAGVAVLSFTSSILLKKLLKEPNVEPVPVDYRGMQELLDNFKKWREKDPTGDATKRYNITELATLGIANALYDIDKPISEFTNEDDLFERRPLLAVGHGETDTYAIVMPVHVDISNAFIYHPDANNEAPGKALEEAISFCDLYVPFVEIPKVGRRDFYNMDGDNIVNSNKGSATSPTKITWESKFDKDPISKEDYEEEVGKIPDNPFLYSVDKETVLNDSTTSKTSDGYQINVNLDTVKGVARYKKRMYYLSGKRASHFKYVHLTFNTDDNLRLTSMNVDEQYAVDDSLETTGKLTTKFYYEDKVPEIPATDVSFDYSKYPA